MEDFNQTQVHPLGLAALVVTIVLALVLPRRFALAPVLILACLVPANQRMVIGGLDFSFLRLLLIACWARLILRNETRGFVWTPLDTAFLIWPIVCGVVYVAREGTTAAMIWRIGWALEAFGVYFFVRQTVRTWADLDRMAQSVLVLSIPTAVFFAVEWATGRNMFSVMGGVPEITSIRDGRLRCQGSFDHPIIAGVFWAAFLPLVAARWWVPSANRAATIAGVLSILFIVVASASSTPLLSVAAALAAAFLFPIRFHLRYVRWATVASLVALHIVMKAPVWHLISRIDLVGGSTGYQRYKLIDSAVESILRMVASRNAFDGALGMESSGRDECLHPRGRAWWAHHTDRSDRDARALFSGRWDRSAPRSKRPGKKRLHMGTRSRAVLPQRSDGGRIVLRRASDGLVWSYWGWREVSPHSRWRKRRPRHAGRQGSREKTGASGTQRAIF